MISPDIIQELQETCNRTFCCSPTITRIEEYDPKYLYEGLCEEVGHTDDWSWIDRVFKVYFILHDYPAQGQSLPSDCIIALPKREMQEINSFIVKKPAPLAVYDISEGNTIKMLPGREQHQSQQQ